MTTFVLTPTAPTVEGPPQGQWTYSDWETLPQDGNRYEIIDGMLYMTTAPSNFHQWIVSRLFRHLGIPAEDRNLAVSFMALIGVLMPGCDPVQPDFVLVRKTNAEIIQDGRIRGVPDLIVEVLSPSTGTYDEKIKLFAYAQAGVPEYAIVKPQSRTLDLYVLDERRRYSYPRSFGESQQISFACLPGLTLTVSDLFSDAPDTTL